MTNKTIARYLKQTADLLEVTGGNPFRSRAYRNASRLIDRLEEPAARLAEEDRLTEIEGIGAGLAGDIGALVRTGTFKLLDELLATIPPGLIDVLRVKGLGTKKVRQLWMDLDITSLEELEHAAQSGRLATIGGFGKKTQENILRNIETLKRYRSRRRYADVMRSLEPVLALLRRSDGIGRVEVAGELRRKLETIARADVVVEATPDALRDALGAEPLIDVSPDPDDADLLTSDVLDGLPLHFHPATADTFGTDLWRLTGAQAHVAAFVERHGAPESASEEHLIYQRAGLPLIPPELREGTDELALKEIPRLIEDGDLRGTLHNHSTWSDGTHTIREMVEAARAKHLEYFGLCDHSRSLTIASGLSIEQVYQQQEEVRALNAEYEAAGVRFRIFSGTEADILADGSLDYPDDVLASFDFVVASVHSGFEMTADVATERIIRAVENPYTRILGHPTGRLLLVREGYPIHHREVIAACAAYGVAIELNANPYRLDLDWRWIEEATKQGVLIAINPDAHSTSELDNTRWGVAVARKARLTAEQCLNAKSLEAFEEWLREGRG